jgi:LPXTG-motif cell wall-anchored protein
VPESTTTTIVTTTTRPPELPRTGAELWMFALLGGALALVGTAMVRSANVEE